MREVKGMLICFIGIDGSGKSTLARKAISILSEYGVRSKYVWGGSNLHILRQFIKLVRRPIVRKADPFRDYSGYHAFLQEMGNRRILFRIYLCFFLLEYLTEILIKIRIPLWLGGNVVSDRYVFDVITSNAANYGLSFHEHQKLVENMLRICPKPQMVYLVDIPEEEAMSRKDDVPSIEYLINRRKYYQNISRCCWKRYNVKILDGSRDLDDLVRSLAHHIKALLPGKEVSTANE